MSVNTVFNSILLLRWSRRIPILTRTWRSFIGSTWWSHLSTLIRAGFSIRMYQCLIIRFEYSTQVISFSSFHKALIIHDPNIWLWDVNVLLDRSISEWVHNILIGWSVLMDIWLHHIALLLLLEVVLILMLFSKSVGIVLILLLVLNNEACWCWTLLCAETCALLSRCLRSFRYRSRSL
jgi:hypothetical protein